MPHYRRARLCGGSFFFTVVTERRQRILTDPRVRLALRQAIQAVRQEWPFLIDGWVLLPEHLHAIWTLPAGDDDYATRWRLIKGRVTRQLGAGLHNPLAMTERRRTKGYGSLWQHRYWEHWLRDEDDMRRHLDYLHFNPVKHGLVERVVDWQWSTFHRHVAAGVYPVDWGGEAASGEATRGLRLRLTRPTAGLPCCHGQEPSRVENRPHRGRAAT